MIGLIHRSLGIRTGEGVRIGLMFAYLFLVVSCLMIVKSVAQSLFLAAFGVQRLSYAFIMVAVVAAIAVAVYSRLLRHTDFMRLVIRTLQASICSLALFWTALQADFFRQPMIFIFYLWVAVFGLLAVSQFWILSNTVFNPREARRLISVIGAGAIAGGILGGYLTRLTAGILGSSNLLLICIGCLSICIVLTQRLYRHIKRDAHLVRLRQKERVETESRVSFRGIAGSRHLAYLAAVVGIGGLAAKLVEYQFSAAAAAAISDPDRLTAFFGFWLSNISILSLLVQLTVTRRVVGRIGVGLSLLFLPAIILIGSVIILIHPVLWAAVLLKAGDGGLKNSLNKAALELIILPIPPAVKNPAKTFIDVFVDSAATGLGGIFLLVLTRLPGWPSGRIALVTTGIVAGWIGLVFCLRREYLQSFRRLLATGKTVRATSAQVPDRRTIMGDIAEILAGTDSAAIVHTLRTLRTIPVATPPSVLQALIRHPDPRIQLEALKTLYLYRSIDCSDDVLGMITLNHQNLDLDVLTEAIHYLFRKKNGERVKLLDGFFQADDPRLSGAALLSAARESRRNPRLQNQLNIRARAEHLIRQIPAIKDPGKAKIAKSQCARVIGAANIPALYPFLHIFLNDGDPDVAAAAVRAAGESRERSFVPALIRKLAVAGLQEACGEALGHFGPNIVELLDDHLRNPLLERPIRTGIPNAMRASGTQTAADRLAAELDQKDPAIRFAVIRALNRLHAYQPQLKLDHTHLGQSIVREAKGYLNLLTALYLQINTAAGAGNPAPDAAPATEHTGDDAGAERAALAGQIEQRLQENMERIFRLLGLKYPAEDIYSVYRGIRSSKPDLRLNAVEFLDNLLETDLKQAVIPIVENALLEPMVARSVERLGLKIPSERDALELVVPEADPELQLTALNMIRKLGDPQYAALAAELMGSADARVREAAGGFLRSIGYLSV